MPEFLMILGDHLYDSEPIPVSTFLNSFFFQLFLPILCPGNED
jgi:hypothetical protein